MKPKHLFFPLFLVIFAVVALALYWSDLATGDWPVFHHATRALLHGTSPYWAYVGIEGKRLYLYNPPWTLLFLVPFTLLPERVGWSFMAVFSHFLYAFTFRRLGASLLIIAIPILLVPNALLSGNIDALSFVGIVLPARIGLFFAFIKPQNTIAIILYWFFTILMRRGFVGIIKVFLPVTIVLFLSVAFFGPWFLWERPFSTSAHLGFFPDWVPYGLALLFLSIVTRRKLFAVVASPLLSPYVSHAAVVLFSMTLLLALQGFATWLYRLGVRVLFLIHRQTVGPAQSSPQPL